MAVLVLSTSSGCQPGNGVPQAAPTTALPSLSPPPRDCCVITVADFICHTGGCHVVMRREQAETDPLVVKYVIENIRLTAGADPFTSRTGTVTFAAGATTASLFLATDSVRLKKAAGTFTVVLSANGHRLADAVGTIPLAKD
jgi:hypothetical protein